MTFLDNGVVSALTRLDAVTFELLKNNINTVVDEMTVTVVRTAYSTNIRDGMDFSTAICDSRGQMVAQGVCIALHLGSIPDAMAAVLERYSDSIQPGDVFIMNDPYTGGMHLPDIFLFKPVFANHELLCFLVVVADHLDIGGRTPGSRAVDSTEIYQEGLRIPPLKFFEAGRPVQAIWDVIAQNVRVPTKVLGDLRSGLAGFHSAEQLLLEAVERFGLETTRQWMESVLSYSERVTRQEIALLPDGHYRFTDFIDDSVVVQEPLRVQMEMEIRGDELYFDLTGTAPQVPAAINSTLSFTKSAIYAAVRTLMPTDLPNNAGFFRPIHVLAPPGTIVNPREPAAVASRGVTGSRVVDACLGVLAQAAPDRVPAACEGGPSSVRIGGYDMDGKAFVIYDSIAGTWGARPDRDGIDGCAAFSSNLANVPAEVIEAEFPVRICRYGLRSDTGGPGKFRGGLGLEREWELLAGEAIMTMRADRGKFHPWGLKGGHPGVNSCNILNAGTEARELPSKVVHRLRAGDRFLHRQASGGGVGDPLERDPELVYWDWRNEKVSLGKVEVVYGVVIDQFNRRVDLGATERLRARLRQATDTDSG